MQRNAPAAITHCQPVVFRFGRVAAVFTASRAAMFAKSSLLLLVFIVAPRRTAAVIQRAETWNRKVGFQPPAFLLITPEVQAAVKNIQTPCALRHGCFTLARTSFQQDAVPITFAKGRLRCLRSLWQKLWLHLKKLPVHLCCPTGSRHSMPIAAS